MFDSQVSGFQGKRSEILDRNNKRDTSFNLARLTAGCQDFNGKRSKIRDRNNEQDTSFKLACLTAGVGINGKWSEIRDRNDKQDTGFSDCMVQNSVCNCYFNKSNLVRK